MKYCEYCGKARDTDAETCPACGVRLRAPEDGAVPDDALAVTEMLLAAGPTVSASPIIRTAMPAETIFTRQGRRCSARYR